MFFNNKFNRIRTICFSIIYIICSLIQSFIGQGRMTLNFLPENIPSVTLNGCFSTIALYSIILIVICSNGKHFKTALVLQGIELVYIIIPILKFHSIGSLPAIFQTIFGIAVTIILALYIRKVKINEQNLNTIVYIDALTGCLNRRGLIRELSIKSNLGKEFYLIFLDLDNFKQINDLLGHSIGDQLLKDISERWSNLPFLRYTLFRLGGDEFAIILESSDINKIERFMEELFKSMESIDVKFSSIITTSAGIAHHTKDTTDINQLLIYADTAMYNAKKAGKNTYKYFDMKSYKELAKRYLTEEDIRRALNRNTFELRYQPQYDIKSHELIGLEALLRMKNKYGNYTKTQDFINVAEKSCLIYDIDLWVIKNVLFESANFVKEHPNVEVSVNVSGKHIIAFGFTEYLINCLKEADFPPTNLKIEITESSYIKNIDDAVRIIKSLKSLGIKIALDDFGTGYSSLSYLSRIPVDLLKIDKSFVDNIELDKNKSNFVDVIIKLGHLMNCKVIAEGVENDEQLDILLFLGCDYIQGFIWGKPMELSEID